MKTMKNTQFDDLKKIYLLKTFNEQGSLNKTAQIHKVTPSAVSQSIKSLETNLGYPVIIKIQDSWQMTEKGKLLLQMAEKVFQALETSFPESKSTDLQIASLSIGTYESIALDVIHNFSHKIRLDFPEVKLNFQISRNSDLIKKIQSGELCLAIISQHDEIPTGFMTKTLFTDHLGIYASPALGITSLSEITDQMMGVISTGANGLPSYFKKFLKENFEFKPNLVCDSFEVLRELAEKADAVVILPKRVAAKSRVPLTELATPITRSTGEHKILLVASETCDRQEFEYVSLALKT